MYRIYVLADQDAAMERYVNPIIRFCSARGLFPQIECHGNQESFFESVRKAAPTNALIALPGVAGLNAAEHLRSLLPACGIIWCSDLDFSLQAFRLRADYFMLEPAIEETLLRGLNVWFEEKNARMIQNKTER